MIIDIDTAITPMMLLRDVFRRATLSSLLPLLSLPIIIIIMLPACHYAAISLAD